MIIRRVLLPTEKQRVINFLTKFHLSFDKDIVESFYIEENDEIIATISRSKDTIKCLAVDDFWQGQNLTAQLIQEVTNSFHEDNIYHYFVFTTINNKVIFEELGFNKISSSQKVIIFEKGIELINDQIDKLKNQFEFHFGIRVENHSIGSIVVNCNPVTKGHQELIEYMSKRHDYGVVFLVSEDLSFFTYKERQSLLYLSINHLDNILILPSTKYMVSTLTFPTYFFHEDEDVELEQSYLDAKIFKDYFMPKFNISKRYVGTEEKGYMKKYNNILKMELGQSLIEVDRFTFEGEIISASKVRELIKKGKYKEACELVPNSVKTLFNAMIRSKYHEWISKVATWKRSL